MATWDNHETKPGQHVVKVAKKQGRGKRRERGTGGMTVSNSCCCPILCPKLGAWHNLSVPHGRTLPSYADSGPI